MTIEGNYEEYIRVGIRSPAHELSHLADFLQIIQSIDQTKVFGEVLQEVRVIGRLSSFWPWVAILTIPIKNQSQVAPESSPYTCHKAILYSPHCGKNGSPMDYGMGWFPWFPIGVRWYKNCIWEGAFLLQPARQEDQYDSRSKWHQLLWTLGCTVGQRAMVDAQLPSQLGAIHLPDSHYTHIRQWHTRMNIVTNEEIKALLDHLMCHWRRNSWSQINARWFGRKPCYGIDYAREKPSCQHCIKILAKIGNEQQYINLSTLSKWQWCSGHVASKSGEIRA